MRLPTIDFPAFRRPGSIVSMATIAAMGLILFLAAIAACSPTTGANPNFWTGVTTPIISEETPSPNELTAEAATENPHSLKVNASARAIIATGKLEYQLEGQNSVSVEANEEVPLETDVKIWSNDGIAKVGLEDGSTLVINPHTLLNLIIIEQGTTAPTIRVQLLRGSLLIASKDLWILSGDYQFRVHVNQSIAGVNFDPLQDTMTVNCLGQNGGCSFYTATEWNELAPGQQLDYTKGVRGKVRGADSEGWQLLIEEISPTPTITPSPYFTPLPTLTPTFTVTPEKAPTATSNSEPDNRDTGPDEGGDGGHGG